jgi:hypothetical protein
MASQVWFEVFARRMNWGRNIEIALLSKPDPRTGKRTAARPVQMEPVDDEELVTEPTFSLRPDEAQQLMDELWRCGLRPTEGSGSAGSLAATERHLKDMQAIAMGLLRKEGMPPCPT